MSEVFRLLWINKDVKLQSKRFYYICENKGMAPPFILLIVLKAISGLLRWFDCRKIYISSFSVSGRGAETDREKKAKNLFLGRLLDKGLSLKSLISNLSVLSTRKTDLNLSCSLL